MPRKTRTHYFEAMYHVMLRGNYRQIIFGDDNDRLYFYSLLKKVTEKYNCKIHLFV
jgi:REP element-mobilizing transposase RayT